MKEKRLCCTLSYLNISLKSSFFTVKSYRSEGIEFGFLPLPTPVLEAAYFSLLYFCLYQ